MLLGTSLAPPSPQILFFYFLQTKCERKKTNRKEQKKEEKTPIESQTHDFWAQKSKNFMIDKHWGTIEKRNIYTYFLFFWGEGKDKTPPLKKGGERREKKGDERMQCNTNIRVKN
jgi:hypothetical protein